jgi:hypothetical protein
MFEQSLESAFLNNNFNKLFLCYLFMDKRGQFYLMAAVIISAILLGISTVKNYANTKEKPDSMKEIGIELREEGYRLVEYSENKDPGEDSKKNDLIENFLAYNYSEYFLEKTNNADAVFIYGKGNSLHALKYTKGDSYSSINVEGENGWDSISKSDSRKTDIEDSDSDNKINVKIDEKNYYFKISNGNIYYFYYLIYQENNGEIYVQTNEK